MSGTGRWGGGRGVLSLLSEVTFDWDWEREEKAFLYHGRWYWLLSLSRGHESLSGLWERKQILLLPQDPQYLATISRRVCLQEGNMVGLCAPCTEAGSGWIRETREQWWGARDEKNLRAHRLSLLGATRL